LDILFEYVSKYIQLFRWNDIIDISVIICLALYIAHTIKGTRAVQLLKGIVILIIVLQASIWLKLTAVEYILQTVMQVGMFAVIVIFQPELRSMLEKLGRSRAGRILNADFFFDENEPKLEQITNEIVEAAVYMAKRKTGALIVIERETRLGEIMTTGSRVNADVTAMLLENIFFHNAPLHDGAVIIRGSRIMNAGCILPLTSNPNLSPELGTRHRAAVGISEVSDAIVIVVSEETGKISISTNGTMMRNITGEGLRKTLLKALGNKKPSNALDKIKFWRGLNNNGKKTGKQ